jgi:hypothetical protein
MNEKELIKRAKGKYKLGERMLEKVIKRDCWHNRYRER